MAGPYEQNKGNLGSQVGGEHYRTYPVQPLDFITKNNLGFCEGNVIKYVTRHKDKGKAEDIRKAIHYLNLILEFQYPEETQKPTEDFCSACNETPSNKEYAPTYFYPIKR